MRESKSAQRASVERRSTGILHLEKALQPPHLEDALAEQHDEPENAPPLDSRVGALGCVAVRALADDDVGLFVADEAEEVG